MKSISLDDVIPYADYERQRESYRARIIALKQRRRISVGPLITLVFENRDTLQFQIQEMIRVERIFDPAKVQDELDVYNALLPSSDELSATLLIEITEEAKMKPWLDAFMGLDRGHTVAITAGGERVYGEFEGGHSHETKISAVHFVRFRPTAAMKAAFADLHQPVTLGVHHGSYRAETSVPGSMREEWLSDLKTHN
ncbi:DUF3501 family protein [Nitrospira moscoviensis]|uniref:DUF3501 domain-containing protein n=1 Tax=Nitrospira moscoviensis TaxID=42253 RepID=A0A0K2GIE2_NITMO|nr:DUF3501 family protein [Nitrospira moscoviensis]ALA60715.1 hypothetical protein NITMOv2_4339 [Nitrospira moscoviensis]